MQTPEEAKAVHGQVLSEIDGVTMVAPSDEKLLIGVEAPAHIEEVRPYIEGMLANVVFEIEFRVTGTIRQTRRTGKVRPLKGGANIAPDGMNGYGTAGFLMTNGNKYFVVSNNHVFAASDTLSMGHSIVQPADPFQGGKNPPFKIGELAGKIRLRDGVDGDIAWATVEVEADNRLIGIGEHEGSAITVRRGNTLRKSGATSAVTTGKVASVDATIVSEDHDGSRRRVEGCIITEDSMSEGGDSGSPVVKKDGQGRWRPAGIIFAGSPSLSAITPAKTIERLSGLDFANSYEPGLPDSASMCLPDGNGELQYTLNVAGKIRGRDGELEPDDTIIGTVVGGRLTGGHCDKFEFEGPIQSLSWEGDTPNFWLNGDKIDLHSVGWADPPRSGDPNPDPTPDPEPSPEPGGGGGLILALAALAFMKNR